MAGFDSRDEDSGWIAGINITPFVDVALVLLVIFMITAPMMVKDVLNLKLPKTASSDGQATQTLGVAINRDGNILLSGTLTDEAGLAESVRSALAQNPQVQGIIAADTDVAYGRVVKVIDILKRAGLERFAVQIERDASP